jgi:hypothetical protein
VEHNFKSKLSPGRWKYKVEVVSCRIIAICKRTSCKTLAKYTLGVIWVIGEIGVIGVIGVIGEIGEW